MGKESKAGRHPRGVSFDKSHRGKKKYKTRVFFNGKDRFIGRFETVQEASKAYEAAAAYFKESPDQAEKPEFLQLVRELVQGQDADPHNSSSRIPKQRAVSPAPASLQPQQTDLGLDESFLPYPASEQYDIYTQQQQCNSQDSISDASDPLMGVGCEGATVADAAQTGCAAAAMDVEQPAAAALNACCSWPAANGSPDMGDSCQAVSEVMMEEVMAQEVYRAIGLIPAPQQQLPLCEPHMTSAGLLRGSNSSSNLPAAAFLQQQEPLQRPQSATPSLGCSVGTAAMGLAGASGSGSLTSALMQVQQQQQDEELQQLLHMVLQGAGEVMDCPAPGLHDQALEDCCTEFLAATAAAAGPATPAMSAPACGYPPQHTLAHQQQQQFVNGRSCAIPAVSSVSGGAARAAAAAAAGDAGGYIPTAEALARELRSSGGLCRQGSLLLLQADSCMDAVLYVASVVRAVLELYTTLLHRGEEDAAGDILNWLSTFRQQQQQRQLSVLTAAAAAPGIPPTTNLDSLNNSVVQIMARIVQSLVTASGAASAASARAAVRASSRSSLEVTSGVTGAGAGGAAGAQLGAPLARRSFVTAVLERLNNYLVGLHMWLQQQQALVATPGALWQEVQRWIEQLRAQAVTAEDAVAVQLAALL